MADSRVHFFSFWGQQLHKMAGLCNCWPIFEQTVAHRRFESLIPEHFETYVIVKSVSWAQ